VRYNAPFTWNKVERILDQQQSESKNDDQLKHIPFWRVVLSVIQASFGVQNRQNLERDFKQGQALPFVIAAVIFTAVFVLLLMLVVKLVLNAG